MVMMDNDGDAAKQRTAAALRVEDETSMCMSNSAGVGQSA